MTAMINPIHQTQIHPMQGTDWKLYLTNLPTSSVQIVAPQIQNGRLCLSVRSFASSALELTEVLEYTYQRSSTELINYLVEYAQVISVNLDEWTDEEVNCLANSGGNATVNTKYEAFLPENYKKPRQDFATEDRAIFIRKKYELQQFVTNPQFACPLHKHGAEKRHNQQHSGSKHGTFRNSWMKKESENKGVKKMMDVGMVEFVGLIKVDIIRGTDLAVRDVMSSDPYVMIILGHQSMKTKVIKNTLNPIWNERLMLSIPDPVPPLKVLVFDKDTFTSDDRMGEAEVDIQPLISAAREYQSSIITESTQICTFLASENSILAKDSIISIVGGKVEQEIALRLQNVEHGELEIKLECVPLNQ
uniref:Putative ADP-ribosylation factor GTPase-activating protein AGD11 n=1 Tax=Aegilops tauschii TaxID=37682 RepID=R7W6J9_AEGTA